jgi:hypothetical protein
MGLLDNTHARRAAILMCVLAWLMPAASAGSLQVSHSLALPREVAEPFGLPVSPIYWGGLLTKWQGVVRKLDDERVQDAAPPRPPCNFSPSSTRRDCARAAPGWVKSIAPSISQSSR